MSNSNPSTKDVRGIIASVLIILIGSLIIQASRSYETLGAVFPSTIGITMIVLAAVYIVMALLGHGGSVGSLQGSNWRRVGIFVVLLLWAFLLEVLGFLTASLLGYCFGLLVANFDRWTPRSAVVYCGVGATVVVSLFLLFGQVLKVSFPTGMFI